MENLVKVQCILDTGYNDADLGEFIDKNRIYYVTEERAKLLEDQVDTLDNIEEVEEKKEEKPKRRNRRSM